MPIENDAFLTCKSTSQLWHWLKSSSDILQQFSLVIDFGFNFHHIIAPLYILSCEGASFQFSKDSDSWLLNNCEFYAQPPSSTQRFRLRVIMVQMI
jgi:hypothetical protein